MSTFYYNSVTSVIYNELGCFYRQREKLLVAHAVERHNNALARLLRCDGSVRGDPGNIAVVGIEMIVTVLGIGTARDARCVVYPPGHRSGKPYSLEAEHLPRLHRTSLEMNRPVAAASDARQVKHAPIPVYLHGIERLLEDRPSLLDWQIRAPRA